MKVRRTPYEYQRLERELKHCNRIIESAEAFSTVKECAHCKHHSTALDAKILQYVEQYELILKSPTRDHISELLDAKVAFAKADICRNLKTMAQDMVDGKRLAIFRREEIVLELKVKPGEILR